MRSSDKNYQHFRKTISFLGGEYGYSSEAYLIYHCVVNHLFESTTFEDMASADYTNDTSVRTWRPTAPEGIHAALHMFWSDEHFYAQRNNPTVSVMVDDVLDDIYSAAQKHLHYMARDA